MLLRGYFIIARAEQAQKYPDTVYCDIVDLETGRPFQFSTKAMTAAQLANYGKEQVMIDAEAQLRDRQGGGYSVIFDRLQVVPVSEIEAAKKQKSQQ